MISNICLHQRTSTCNGVNSDFKVDALREVKDAPTCFICQFHIHTNIWEVAGAIFELWIYEHITICASCAKENETEKTVVNDRERESTGVLPL